ncbi:MAG TPA: ABC transporter permease [Hypericibacter adhaerens]|jgi:putative spermidine/putrescine transport system permease protein|uniref:ABC transporter permease n=1 Tax=Hypericibacter adhaerens TaxID=2602016 RepID=UPI002BFCFC67|nr:ABC transporter permease [Hypericibacter adhaerens]HWA45820.1 ABC transporter permease [Hypericibacter adhaerens]
MLLSLNRMGPGRFGLYAIGILVAAFLLLPIVFIAALSFGSSRWLAFPPPGWTLQWYEEFFADSRWIDAILVSIRVGAAVMAASILLGLPASFALVRGRFRGRELLRAFFIGPMIVPLIILAIALYGLFLRIGLNGTFIGFVAGHLVIALPFSIICISNALESFDESIEKAAIICGATPAQAIWRITLPSIRMGIFAGALFSFLASWDEVVVGIFMASPDMQTLPVRMWNTLRNDLSPVIAAVSTLLILVTIAILAVVMLVQKKRAR